MIPPRGFDADLCVRLAVTLGHFVWQGTAIALVAFLVVALLRRASAGVRYGVLVVAMGVMALCMPVTFVLVDVPSARDIVERDAAGTLPGVPGEMHEPVAAARWPVSCPWSGRPSTGLEPQVPLFDQLFDVHFHKPLFFFRRAF